MERIRCFFAYDIEDPALVEAFTKAQEELMRWGGGAGLKLVAPQNLHLTLRFVGEQPKPLVDKMCEFLSTLRFEPFEVEFRGMGAFPSLRRINVIWVGVGEGAEKLAEIAKRIDDFVVKKLGIKPDPKGFSPHLTLARVKTGIGRDALVKVITRHASTEFGRVLVDRVRLKRSMLTPKGPIYSTICEARM